MSQTDDLPALPEPDAYRVRYRSEPGMIGHYPWTYADFGRKKYLRAECEYEDLFGEEKVDTIIAAARAPLLERIAVLEAALQWYERQSRLCRLIHAGGDAGRQALAADGGKRARAALKGKP